MPGAPNGQLWKVVTSAAGAGSGAATLTVGTQISSAAKRVVITGYNAGSTAAGIGPTSTTVTVSGSSDTFIFSCPTGGVITDMEIPIDVVNGTVITFTWTCSSGTHKAMYWGYWI